MHILITGGAGYIGSHTAKQLLELTTHRITIIDNLSTGSIQTIKTLESIRSFHFIHLDLKEVLQIQDIFERHSFDVVIHFAASIVVPESITDPIKYYLNNTTNTSHLIHASIHSGVKKFIFSSTAAVYGEPNTIPQKGIDELFETIPINPYGASKLMSEQILQESCSVHEMKYIIFRYFNVAGADINYNHAQLTPRIGQSFPKATHLIKVACEVAVGKRKDITIFGTDFPTTDGTGIRDYIHVDDLANAHILAIDYLDDSASDIFNAGYGIGYSVQQVLDTINSDITPITITKAGRRAGDPSALIANSDKLKKCMNWQPQYNDLKLICNSAYQWEKLH